MGGEVKLLLDTHASVSYTHLDVYKRQRVDGTYHRAFNALRAFGLILQRDDVIAMSGMDG